ncbi:MAG: RsmE family RNA methyltransferase [Acetobacteraceae bacterium]
MPGSIRLFHPAPLAVGGTVTLSAPQRHYLGTVMRRRAGDAVHPFNRSDGEFLARILPGGATLAVEAGVRGPEAESPLWLLFAPLKRDATDLVIRQATELGATDLQAVLTLRGNTRVLAQQRAEAIAIEAAEQSERLGPPAIHPVRGLAELLAEWSGPPLFAALERAGARPPCGVSGPAALLVGPEGGFAPTELDLLRSHPLVTPIGLGRTILRAETAVVAGLALLQAARWD